MERNIWSVLGIEETLDKKAIQNAYAEKLKYCHPEENPQEFQILQVAYNTACSYAKFVKKFNQESLDSIQIEETRKADSKSIETTKAVKKIRSRQTREVDYKPDDQTKKIMIGRKIQKLETPIEELQEEVPEYILQIAKGNYIESDKEINKRIEKYMAALAKVFKIKIPKRACKMLQQIFKEEEFEKTAFQKAFMVRLKNLLLHKKIIMPIVMSLLSKFYADHLVNEINNWEVMEFWLFLTKESKESYVRWKKSLNRYLCFCVIFFIAMQSIKFTVIKKEVYLFGKIPTQEQVETELLRQYHMKEEYILKIEHDGNRGGKIGRKNLVYQIKYNNGKMFVDMSGLYKAGMAKMSDMEFNCESALLEAYIHSYMDNYYLAASEMPLKIETFGPADDENDFQEMLFIKKEQNKADFEKQFELLLYKIYEDELLLDRDNEYCFNIYVGEDADRTLPIVKKNPEMQIRVTKENYKEQIVMLQEQLAVIEIK